MPIPHLLYIDNDFESKKNVVILLFNNGMEVFPAANIKEATMVLRTMKIDGIICDMHLPDGDADHLLQTVKSSPALNQIPIIVVSQKPNEDEKQRVLQLGAVTYLSKQENSQSLLKTVRDTIAVHGHPYKESSTGISGQLAKLKIVDLIVHMAKDHGSGCISIEGRIPMEIHLRNGNILHARHGITVGEKALFRCLRIAEAAFHFQAEEYPIEATVRGSLTGLMKAAKISNEKLMANYHKLPNPNFRVRVINQEALARTNLKAEARAALEICRKYPRIGAYLDRLNLPDIVCYEYLVTFLGKKILRLETENKPVKILTDSCCDISPQDLKNLGVALLPLRLQAGEVLVGNEDDAALEQLYKRKAKHLEQCRVKFPEEDLVVSEYSSHLPDFDCLSIFNNTTGLLPYVKECIQPLCHHGLNGQSLLANEITVLNSRSLSIGLGLLVRFAAKLASGGMQIETIEEMLEQAMEKSHSVFAVYADRSPLVKRGSTSLLLKSSSQPAIASWDGTDFLVSEKLSKNEDVVNLLISQVIERIERRSHLHIAVGHVRAEGAGERLRTALIRQLNLSYLPLISIGPVCGHRLGPGAIGVAFFQE